MENPIDYFFYQNDFWQIYLNKYISEYKITTVCNSTYGPNSWDLHQYVIDGLIVYGRKDEIASLFVAGENHHLYEKVNNIK